MICVPYRESQEALKEACELLEIEPLLIDATQSIETIHQEILSYM